jgi:hypothetical protein
MREQAWPWKVGIVMLSSNISIGCKLDILPASFKPTKLCTINRVLPSGVIALIRQHPENEVFRTIVLTHTKIPIPDECKTYEQIKDWIESNIDPTAQRAQTGALINLEEDELVMEPLEVHQVGIEVSASQRVSGSARFRGREIGRGVLNVSLDEIIAQAENAHNWEGLLELVEEIIEDDNNIRDTLELELDEANAEYDRHESEDTEDYDWEVINRQDNIRRLREAILRHAPEVAAQLDMQM